MVISESHIRQIVRNVLTEMRAFHGSGARFNRFNSSYMGSGEGSQCYGPGHYFTSSKQIGKDYTFEHELDRNDIPNVIYRDNEGDFYYQGQQLYHAIDDILDIDGIDGGNENYLWKNIPRWLKGCESKQAFIHKLYYALIKAMKDSGRYSKNPKLCQRRLREALEYLRNNLYDNRRSLYQVEIPDDANYADWFMEVPVEWYHFISEYLYNHSDYPETLLEKVGAYLDEWEARYGSITVEALYYSLYRMHRNPEYGNILFRITLKYFGYVGVRYPSGTNFHTSSAKDGDMNYTVFDDENVNITNRWDY